MSNFDLGIWNIKTACNDILCKLFYQKKIFMICLQWMADLDVVLFFQINFQKKLDHRLSMGTHFC